MITQGAKLITGFNVDVLRSALIEYDDFSVDSDPHRERDFGALMFLGWDIMRQVSYYEKELDIRILATPD